MEKRPVLILLPHFRLARTRVMVTMLAMDVKTMFITTMFVPSKPFFEMHHQRLNFPNKFGTPKIIFYESFRGPEISEPLPRLRSPPPGVSRA